MSTSTFSPNDHNYCKECIQRACTVAIGDGLTELKCLMHCDKPFTLASLQAALGKQTFLKWLKKIQIAEIEKVICNFINSVLCKLILDLIGSLCRVKFYI